MNAVRRNSKSNLRAFFSSIPLPSIPVATPVQSKAKKRGRASQAPVKAQPYKKKKITGALREAVWIKTMGKVFEGKCPVAWCPNTITVFDFQSGHNIPESKGGSTTLPNLIPICARCNFSMGNQYTIDEWNALHASPTPTPISMPIPIPIRDPELIKKRRSFFQTFFCCFFKHSN
jgi:5-methylcytosine-specific restriction endonuclease McrA